MSGVEIDWRARAVAHANAIKVLLQGKPEFPGTFAETWVAQANETISADFNTEPFGAGLVALEKDLTLAAPNQSGPLPGGLCPVCGDYHPADDRHGTGRDR